ncbi:hypothetical protein AMS68_003311 [Peltaster fructicola]|uniref:ASST-domain-containing protein n=1 Tax=Peltaster fructicola TaxID=286661 RepID=A0A6H0XST1_9PEZI|nr:hypothetical protein AMS68_003311 [Peltaster fructicola]
MRGLVLDFWLATTCLAASLHPYSLATDRGVYGAYPVQNYVTEPALTSPILNWLKWDPACEDGRLYFLAPRGEHISNPGPMILDGKGEMIWSHHFDNDFGGQAYDLKVQHYRGQDYLTFWLGNDGVRGHGAGAYYMLDNSYEIIHQVNAAGGLEADLHEFLITPEGTALLTVYDKHYFDLSAYRDFSQDDEQPNYIWDCLLQEVDILSGELLFEWRASDHVNLTDTYRHVDNEGTNEVPWDWFHLNSIAKDELGNYLFSARFTHSVTYIDGRTGDILWTLGGRRNNFMDLSGDGLSLSFANQHDARFHALDAFPGTYTAPQEQSGVSRRLLTLFDNSEDDSISRGLLMEVTYPTANAASAPDLAADDSTTVLNGTDPAFTVRLIQFFENPRGLRTPSQGSMQTLAGEQTKVLVGYGYNAVFTEFDSNGSVLCDVHYGAETSWNTGEIQSYRAFKFEWSSKPKASPRIDIDDDNELLYMSWNGATEVTEWLIQGTDEIDVQDDDWEDLLRVERSGFETTVALPNRRATYKQFVRAIALSSNGTVLEYGTSEVLDRGELSWATLLDITAWTLAEGIVFGVVAAAVILFLYSSKRWRGYHLSRSYAAPLRWKRGAIYRRLSGGS